MTLKPLFLHNLKRRTCDGFAIGYNLIFPIIMIVLLGFVCRSFFRGPEINSFQYYSIVILPFCSSLSIITAAYAGKDDAYANTATRILIAPTTPVHIVLSKILSETLVFSVCSILVLVISSLILSIGNFLSILLVAILHIVLSFTIAAIGTYIGLSMKNFLRIKNIINIPIAVFALLGGSFFRFGSEIPLLNFLIRVSPFTWINRSIFLCIYDNRFSIIYLTIILFAIGLAFTYFAIHFFKKEEYPNGDLPDYKN